MSTNVGHGAAYIQLRPDTTGFRTTAKTLLDAINLDTKVKLRPDLSGFRAAVRTQLNSLPTQHVSVQAKATELRNSVRTALAALPSQRVKVRADVNISAQFTALRAHVSALDGKVIRMRLNLQGAAAAIASLATIRGLANHLDGRTIRINVRVNSNVALSQLGALSGALGNASRGSGRLITAIALLGPAAVPALAAATAGAVALGGALTAVAAGGGVAVLGLFGVFQAVAALNKAQSDRAKASALNARQDRQNANATDQVKAALSQVASAERAYTGAQRDALRAQLEINEAREEAKRDLEDLDSAVKNNALSIRRAQLEIERAKSELDQVLANPGASERQRREAQLAYDEAAQQLDDLGVRQKRLKLDQDAASRSGVEGSKQVIAAQERSRDAQVRVAEAAEGVAAAYRAVESAQRAVSTAAITTSSTMGAALDDLEAKLGNLSPAGESFARFLFGLKPAMIALRQEAETGFLPGLQNGLARLTIYLPKIGDFVRRVGEELGSLSDRASRALAGPQFRAFFGYIDSTATHTLEQFGRVLGNTALGFANLVVAFLPVQRQFTGGLVDMTADFARWSQGLQRNRGFQEFLDYVQTRGPLVIETLGDVTGTLLEILKAAQPVGDVVLGVIKTLAQVIGAFPTPVLTAIVAGFVAMRAAALLSIIPFATIGATLATLPGRLIAMTTSLGAARAGLAAFGATMGGPVVLGILAAGAAIGLFAANTGNAKERVQAAKTAFQQFGDSLRGDITPEALESAQSVLRNNAALRDLVQVAKDAGISSATLVKGLNGDRQARDDVVAAIQREIDAQLALADNGGADYHTEQQRAALKRAQTLAEMAKAFREASNAEERAAALSQFLTLQQEDLTEAMKDGASAADLLRKAYDALNGEALDRQEALEAERAAYDNLREAVERNGPTLDENTKEGRENNRLVRERIQSINDLAAADIAATGQISAETQKRIDNMKRELRQLGFTQDEVNELLGLYQKIPPKVVTEIIIKGGGDAVNGLNAVGKAAANLIATYGVSVDEALLIAKGGLPPSWRGPSPSAQSRADGGLIYGSSPHDRADNIPAWLTADEFVQPVSAVKHYGTDFMEDIRTLRFPKDAARQQMYAAGGLVGGTPVDVKMPTDVRQWKQYPKFVDRTTKMTADLRNVLEAHRQAMFAGGFGSGGEQYVNSVSRAAYQTATSLGATAKVMLALMEAGIVESGMRNLPYGDRDSVGFLQQRPSQGWPNPMDVATATRSFVLRALPKDKLYPNQSAGMLAQRVQVSAFPYKYDQVEPAARGVVGIISGRGVATLGANGSPGFPPWPKSPAAQRGDFGIWRQIVQLINSTGPVSGKFGNAYRPGDPLWHGSSRAVDWMGYNQDYLASFLAARRPLELIHRTKNRDYAYTRGVNKGSFSQGLMEAHRNHIHVAFADGGLVGCLGCAAKSGHQTHRLTSFDRGGDLLPGVTSAFNGTRDREYVATTRADLRNVSLDDETIAKLADAMRTGELGQYTIVRIAQAVSNRPAVLAVDGQVIAEVASNNMQGLAVPGIEVR